MSDSLDYLSFAEPSTTGSSRQFLTQSYEQFSSDGADRFYQPGQSTSIEVSGQSQNSFILPRTMKLVYWAASNTQTLATGTDPTAPEVCDLLGVAGVRSLAGVAFYGAPHIASIQSEVPGLSSNMSALNSDGQSQRWYTQRLLCSGDEGALQVPGYKSSFGQSGRAFAAGGRDLISRSDGITGSFWRLVTDGTNTPVARRDYQCGGFQKFDIPASAWLDLADGCSSVLPLPYLTSSSSNLMVRVNWAPVKSAVVTNARSRGADLITYAVGGVSLQWTAVNIIDSQILASVQSLFRGEVALPIAEGLTIPVPMTLSHRAFRFASTTLPVQSGSVSLRIPAGKACCNSVMLKIDAVANPAIDVAGSFNADHNLISTKPVIRNLVLRVGSARYPAREISDVYSAQATGLGSKWALITTSPSDSQNDILGGPTYIPTSDDIAAEQYKQGRQFFSLFDNDKYDDVPAACLFNGTSGPASMSLKSAYQGNVVTQILAPGVFAPCERFAWADQGPHIRGNGALNTMDTTLSPNMFLFNLQSLLPEMSLRERGYALTGVDLRSQCDVTIEFELLGVAPPGVNFITGPAAAVRPDVVTAWNISAAMEYTEMATLLPSRTDLEASSSLIPSAAGSVASGGTM